MFLLAGPSQRGGAQPAGGGGGGSGQRAIWAGICVCGAAAATTSTSCGLNTAKLLAIYMQRGALLQHESPGRPEISRAERKTRSGGGPGGGVDLLRPPRPGSEHTQPRFRQSNV